MGCGSGRSSPCAKRDGGTHRRGGPDEIEYPVSPSELKADFLSDNRFDLELPGEGKVVVEGVQNDPYHDRTVPHLDEDGEIVKTERVSDIFVDGRVANQPDSRVDVVLGEYGVYGVVFVDDHRYELDPKKVENPLVAADYIQTVTREQATGFDPYDASEEFLSKVSPGSGSSDWHDTDSPVMLDAEWSFRSEHGDWESRINSAFDRYDDLYRDSDANIPISIYRVRAVSELTRGGTGDHVDGEEALDDYRYWIRNGYAKDGVDAYQL